MYILFENIYIEILKQQSYGDYIDFTRTHF